MLPGHVYAALLLSADSDIARVEEGAGRVRLPDRGALYWGKLDVAEHESWKIPIEIVASGAATIEALIWWPRSGPEPYTPPTEEWRSDIDLRLLDASGNEKMRSDSAGEVRERVFDEVPAGSSGKWWSIDIYGYSVPGTEKQPVYWAVWVRDAE